LWISNHNHFGMLFDKNCFCIFYLKNILIFQHWKWPAQGISTLPTVLDAFVANTELLQRTPVKQHWPGRTSTHRHESESSDVPPQSHLRHFTHKHARGLIDWVVVLHYPHSPTACHFHRSRSACPSHSSGGFAAVGPCWDRQIDGQADGHCTISQTLLCILCGQYQLTDWLSCGFTSHSTQNRSFRRRSRKPVSWLGMEKN